jgi:hypothetical protein
MPVAISQPVDQQPLSNGEKYILQTIRNRKLIFLLGAYVGIVGAVAQVIYNQISGLTFRFQLIWFINSPYVLITFLLLVLTIFFIKYYFEAVHPFMKDLAKGKKEIISYKAEKYKTPYFEEFYLQTPLKKRPLIKINRELYDAIDDNCPAHISVAPFCRFVFSIDIRGHKLQFNEKDFILD